MIISAGIPFTSETDTSVPTQRIIPTRERISSRPLAVMTNGLFGRNDQPSAAGALLELTGFVKNNSYMFRK